MRVLVYGAGVIGCELAHRLAKAARDVKEGSGGKTLIKMA